MKHGRANLTDRVEIFLIIFTEFNEFSDKKRKHSSSMHTAHFSNSGGGLPKPHVGRAPWIQTAPRKEDPSP